MTEPDARGAGPDGLPVRLAARVVLLDPDGRVLLMRYDDPLPNGPHWSTPGGGLERGEDFPAGALRELAEETGWTDITLRDEVARRGFVMRLGGDGPDVYQDERLYQARTAVAQREIRGVAAMHASDGIAAWRWWTLAELESTTESVWPGNLASLVRDAQEEAPMTQPMMRLTATVLDAPDARELAAFYQRLLGWPIGANEPDWVTLRPPDGGTGLSFQTEDAYVPPVWPAGPGDTQMQTHLDIEVSDLDAGTEHAVQAGARVAEYQPQDDVRVLLDPAGHPFCLGVATG
jgi:8-oxo-dGTP pyrophosphatase MutT (NUDIX family)/catechol 2,3-dioxygenase-like lactoylglutathione lyase family enzyme